MDNGHHGSLGSPVLATAEAAWALGTLGSQHCCHHAHHAHHTPHDPPEVYNAGRGLLWMTSIPTTRDPVRIAAVP